MTSQRLRCSFQGCSKTFIRQSALKHHETVHRASAPIVCRDCDETFASNTALARHHRAVHRHFSSPRPTKRRRVQQHVQLVGAARIPDQPDQPANNSDTTHPACDDKPVESKPTVVAPEKLLEADLRDIFENAVYFAQQLDIMRTSAVSGWIEEDIRNLHQWAIWVEDGLKDCNEEQLAQLDVALSTKKLSVKALRWAERALMDTWFGYSGFDEQRLKWILQSSWSIEDGARIQTLCDAATDALLRKQLRAAVEQCLRVVRGSRQQLVDEHVLRAQAEAEGNALLLIKRLKSGATLESTSEGPLDPWWGSVTLWAASVSTSEELDKTLSAYTQKAADTEAVWLVDEEVMGEICSRDFVVFDKYLTFLLRTLTVGDEKASEAHDRLRTLGQRNEYVHRKFPTLNISGYVRPLTDFVCESRSDLQSRRLDDSTYQQGISAKKWADGSFLTVRDTFTNYSDSTRS